MSVSDSPLQLQGFEWLVPVVHVLNQFVPIWAFACFVSEACPPGDDEGGPRARTGSPPLPRRHESHLPTRRTPRLHTDTERNLSCFPIICFSVAFSFTLIVRSKFQKEKFNPSFPLKQRSFLSSDKKQFLIWHSSTLASLFSTLRGRWGAIQVPLDGPSSRSPSDLIK